ncbi:MAG: M48 family metallopeptidase [Cephaloticoccus sp.]|nr:M48 family metallopeptidase [Cephaloticoccus sp.]MCF7759114.1 M48 family metallopeptidase [Cephaloticoccus sp.]
MDFFEAQARAKKRTSRLVVLFVVAVLGTMAAGYVAAWIAVGQVQNSRAQAYDGYGQVYASALDRPLFDPKLLLTVGLGTLLVVGLSSWFKWLSFRTGGAAVAESVGGRRIDPGQATPAERRLLNVVEEMSIASGVPMPAVYVLDQEVGINAFAAGLTTNDAVVAVTRGTLEKLNRDELQGVIGHEFSHILNGDMGLNVKLTALLFGILVIGLMGRGVLWSMRGMRVRSGGNRNSGGAVIAIFGIGIAMMIIGYIGYFFGRLIQAAVSRQREFLADASAVQFTRNPEGISGALSKIGGFALGSGINSNKATAIGHFFFAQGFRSNFGGLWATHPPLDERIRAINPRWDGRFFDPPEVVDVTKESFQTKGFAQAPGTSYAVPPIIDPLRRIAFMPAAAVADVGQLTDNYYRHAQDLLANIPATLREAARQVATAPALTYGLLISGDAKESATQQDIVKTADSVATAEQLAGLLPILRLLDPSARLPLLLLATLALRQLDHAAMERFLGTLDELVYADAKVSTFEFVLQKLLTRHLELARTPDQRVDYVSFNAVSHEIAVVLSVMARIGDANPQAEGIAFATGAAQLKLIESSLVLLSPEAADFEALDHALEKLAVSSFPIRKRLLNAAAHVIGSDGTITVEEGELYRAIAVTLDCPLPPLGAKAGTA